MEKIFRKLKRKRIVLNHICEVGVYTPGYSNIIDFIKSGIRTTLIEADPATVKKLAEYFKDYPAVKIYPVAIWDYNGTINLHKAQASTFVSKLHSSPALANDDYLVSDENTFEAECRVFSAIDDGTIDLLSVDIEGSEWYVLKHMNSRPKIISIETHGRYYINPFINNIKNWTLKHGYQVWYKNVSDTVFVRKDIFRPGFLEKLNLKITEGMLALQKLKRTLLNKKLQKHL